MADDMIGTGGTLIKGMKNLRELGAERVICAVSLPLFSGSAIEDFEAAYRQGYFYRIIGTNAVHHKELLQKEWYIQADVTGLFAQIISLVHHNRSVSSMLDNRELVAKRIKKQLERMAKEGIAGIAAHGAAPTHQRLPAERSEAHESVSPEDEPLPHGAA
jgi:ribose-phosphate pyrophosphokinase